MYNSINDLARKVVEECALRGLKVSTAESCTGGMISAALTAIPGSSAVIELGVCSYSNRIKNEVLGVSGNTLEKFSEYSIQCAEEMAGGAVKLSGADLAVATSGVAGPSGGTAEAPVGTVYICAADKLLCTSQKCFFENKSRDYIRAAACEKALKMLLDLICR